MSTTFVKHGLHGTAHRIPARKEPLRQSGSAVLREALGWLGRHLVARVRTRRTPLLQLEFPDRIVNVHGTEEFEFALASRAEVPIARILELMKRSPAELERAAARIREIERCLAGVLARSVHEPALIGEFIREIELKLFSQDHGWRDLVESLMRLSPAYDAYKRVALIKYMQYLRARQSIIRSVFLEKSRGDAGAAFHAARNPQVAGASEHGETSLFDRAETGTEKGDTAFSVLPKGETVRIDLGESRHAELMLAGNRMRLRGGREFCLVDDDDNAYPLHPGKNLVGRHSSCDVVIDAACRAVSRSHLIVEPISERHVLLTDLSSHGTEVRGALLPMA